MFFQSKLLTLIITLPLLMTTQTVYSQNLTLGDDTNKIIISPGDLAVRWNGITVNSPSLVVNGKTQTSTKIINNSNNQAEWALLPSKLKVTARLTEQALEITFSIPQKPAIKRGHPLTLSWFDLPQEETEILYLPFSEGMRIPTNNNNWANYLEENYSKANTTQDLKMPFWVTKQRAKTISYHLVNPTNNTLSFVNAQSHVDMFAEHQFTELNQAQPFKVRITLGDSWIDGAKQYRQWRIDNNQATTLSKQIELNPQVEKLIGASQVYLFGKGLISIEDVADWWGLKQWYFEQTALIIPSNAIKELKSLQKGKNQLNRYHKQLLVDSINNSLSGKYSTPIPSLANNTIAAQYQAAQQQKLWLNKHASKYLIVSEHWGQALSTEMITNLKKAGLKNLWLGLDNWMPAFYQPQVVDRAKREGYLVATYDSYNTAIPRGLNDGWLTAQLPTPMREQCAIELMSGQKKKGFRDNGYYLNPNCQLDYVKQRVTDIIKFGRFNSLFIDVDATAMAREDYRDGSSENDMLSAFNERMNWMATQNDIVLGSEDGNSLTTSGIAFAHGLETVGFGWTDKDMKYNHQSPYFLGRWYPEQKPEFFFKSAKVKEPFKTLLFSPQFRIPLYQVVFHDEVINSHHWHSDSLKFSDVQTERDLISMLYNTPPMVHLTRDEANSPTSRRLKVLQHYQQGYQPIHEQLWDKQLTDFKWLDKFGQVQQTTFSDGSSITANFTADTVVVADSKIPAYSMLARLSNGQTINWTANPNQ
ncbi:glycosyl hydrolase [Vibrio pectenicida]|uniref:Glycosyl hydrolase n=1 Tax=Vibrio pectenicida TaxID=62763 RepID=A0A7Y3ZZ17_9VIBR|nr:glycoside hydrolase [Vibrio pectenicida]NOH71696.1 glycosyl hydrolase [Vibrio pectenicida]